ncbi:MAG: hypothetical protein RR782_07605 [Clostridium sp.]
MKYIRIGLAIIVIISSTLGLMDVLDTDTTTPILFTAVAFLLIINAQECYRSSKKVEAVAFLFTAIFMIISAVFNLYVGLKI